MTQTLYAGRTAEHVEEGSGKVCSKDSKLQDCAGYRGVRTEDYCSEPEHYQIFQVNLDF